MSQHALAAARHGAALLALALILHPATADAHARTGNRLFPATLAVEDPGISDELNLPQVTRFREEGEGWVTETEAGASKRLTENFGVEAEGGWVDTQEASGFDNFGVGAKYVFLNNAPHEFMASAALDWEIGGSGSDDIGEDFSVFTPGFFFGKGMGDLPDSLKVLKPLAITGAGGITLPTERRTEGELNARTLEWGGTVQYSLPYLQQHVKDIGLGGPFNLAIPVVELALESPLEGGDRKTRGTVNPGVIFMGQTLQLGLEAMVPVNGESGDDVGVMLQVHVYLDDLMPGMGKPLW
jgi:hypothetical protein